MHYVTPALNQIFDPYKIPKMLHTEDNFYDVQTTNCTKSLYQIDTICPAV